MIKLSYLKNSAIYVTIMSILMGLLSVSCSESLPVESAIDDSKAYEELRNDLQNMSEEYFRNNKITPDTRSFFSRLWNAVKADVKAIGHISNMECYSENPPKNPHITITSDVCTASKKAYNKIGGKKVNYYKLSPKDQFKIDSLILVYQFDASHVKIDKAHNIALLQMFKQNFDDQGLTQNSIARSRTILKSYGVPEPTLTIAQSAKYVDDYINSYYMPGLGDEKTSELIVTNMPILKEPLKTLDFYFGYAKSLFSPEQVKEYTQAYIETINKSAVDPKMCELMTQSLEVAMASFDLWLTIENLDTEQ